MAGKLFLLFLILPVVEIYLLIQIGGLIGALPTIGLIVGTAIIGSQLMRYQGLQTIREIQDYQRRGEVPTLPILEGAAILLAGALLILPGIISGTIGFLLLIPQLRRWAARRILARVVVITPADAAGVGPNARSQSGHHVIEGNYQRKD